MNDQSQNILVGDIGGTKTILAIFSSSQSPRDPIRIAQYHSRDYDSLEDILKIFLEDECTVISLASFDVAGPVVQGRAQITNLPWVIENASLTELLQMPVVLINDMEAIATTVAHAESIRLATLQAGLPESRGRRAVVAPGTGLGEGFLVWSQDCYISIGSEGGHTDFGPRSPLQVRLLEYLQSKFEHVSYEWVCSGLGIQNLYVFLKESERYPEPEWLREELVSMSDPTPLIVQSALHNRAPICSAALDLFVEILGSETGNLALKILATGGVYLAGGLPHRILPRLQMPTFIKAFTGKGRFREILSQIPLHVVLEPEAALIGAAWTGLDVLARRNE